LKTLNSLLISGGLLAGLVVVVLLGKAVRRRLPENHLSTESTDAVKLAMGLVATMTALLLGLLLSSAKGSYDTEHSEVLQLAAQTTFLDRMLLLYGVEAADARARFRDLMTEYVRRTWPERPGSKVDLALNEEAGNAFYLALERLVPRDDTQRDLKGQALKLIVDLGQLRTLLLVQSISSISKPLLIALACWLVIIFFGFSVVAPPNATTGIALLASAFSVAGALFLILELNQPLGGLIRIPSAPMLNALNHLQK
jgi:hypothetical protein